MCVNVSTCTCGWTWTVHTYGIQAVSWSFSNFQGPRWDMVRFFSVFRDILLFGAPEGKKLGVKQD